MATCCLPRNSRSSSPLRMRDWPHRQKCYFLRRPSVWTLDFGRGTARDCGRSRCLAVVHIARHEFHTSPEEFSDGLIPNSSRCNLRHGMHACHHLRGCNLPQSHLSREAFVLLSRRALRISSSRHGATKQTALHATDTWCQRCISSYPRVWHGNP